MSNTGTISVLELSTMLGVSDDCIYTMVRKKEIPHIKMRSRILFRKESIEAWMSEQEKLNYKSRSQ